MQNHFPLKVIETSHMKVSKLPLAIDFSHGLHAMTDLETALLDEYDGTCNLLSFKEEIQHPLDLLES